MIKVYIVTRNGAVIAAWYEKESYLQDAAEKNPDVIFFFYEGSQEIQTP